MGDPRHEARKLALGSIFCWLFAESDGKACMELTKESLDLNVENADLELAQELVDGVKEHKKEIDDLIAKNAPDWPLNQISKPDLVILRIAIFELMFRKETPAKVAIDEAVEIAKEFGNETSSKFINGVLGALAEK